MQTIGIPFLEFEKYGKRKLFDTIDTLRKDRKHFPQSIFKNDEKKYSMNTKLVSFFSLWKKERYTFLGVYISESIATFKYNGG